MSNWLSALGIAASIALNLWLILFVLVLLREGHELAPRRSGGGTSLLAGLARALAPMLPTPR